MSTPRLAAKAATTPTVQETCRARPCLHSSGEFCAKLNVPLIRYIIEPTLFPKNLCSALRHRTLLSVLISIDDDLEFGLFEYWCSIYSSREVQSKTPFKTQLVSVHRSTPYLTVLHGIGIQVSPYFMIGSWTSWTVLIVSKMVYRRKQGQKKRRPGSNSDRLAENYKAKEVESSRCKTYLPKSRQGAISSTPQ